MKTAMMWAVLAAGLVACGGGEGDACEMNDDCRDGFTCDIEAGQTEGVCMPEMEDDSDTGADA
ncbi:MAG: hypothetical protein AAGA48_14615 [Myxococcota bacterium]